MNKWIPRFFRVRKDGGPDSNVTGHWLVEWKPVFSIALHRVYGWAPVTSTSG